jgi:hypothetical protein
MSEYLQPYPYERPEGGEGMPKTADYLYEYRGMWDKEPDAVCWVRVFEEEGQTPVIVMAEHPRNESTSVTNMAELLAAELIQQHFPQRFDYDPPAILLEHYPRELHTSGRTAMQPTWDRLSFRSWAPRRVWLGGRERLAFGEPHWTRVAEDDVAALIGRDELLRLPPHDAAPREQP